MSTQPESSNDYNGLYQTAEELFSRPTCTHIFSSPRRHHVHYYIIQNAHLERHADGFRAIYSILESGVFVHRLRVEEYPDLGAFYHHHPYGRDAIWQDISDFPTLPYTAHYKPLTETINVWIESPGNYTVYGSVEITNMPFPFQKLLHPLSTWLIVEHPAITLHVVSKVLVGKKRGKIGRTFHNFLHRKGFYKFILKVKVRSPFIGKQQSRIEFDPGFLVIYGKPPINWHETEQHILSMNTSHEEMS